MKELPLIMITLSSSKCELSACASPNRVNPKISRAHYEFREIQRLREIQQQVDYLLLAMNTEEVTHQGLWETSKSRTQSKTDH